MQNPSRVPLWPSGWALTCDQIQKIIGGIELVFAGAHLHLQDIQLGLEKNFGWTTGHTQLIKIRIKNGNIIQPLLVSLLEEGSGYWMLHVHPLVVVEQELGLIFLKIDPTIKIA